MFGDAGKIRSGELLEVVPDFNIKCLELVSWPGLQCVLESLLPTPCGGKELNCQVVCILLSMKCCFRARGLRTTAFVLQIEKKSNF